MKSLVVLAAVIGWAQFSVAGEFAFTDSVPQQRPAPPAAQLPSAPLAPPTGAQPSAPIAITDVQLAAEVDKSTQTVIITSNELLDSTWSRTNADQMKAFFKHCSRTDIRPGMQGRALPANQCMAKVSTGGGVHVTNPVEGERRVVCTDDGTPNFENRVIHAVTEGTRVKTTVFNSYISGEYQSEMRWATRLQNDCDKLPTPPNCGIFFHMYPPNPKKFRTKNGDVVTVDVNRRALGTNVSGGCIRMEESVAWFINRDIREKKKMKVSIVGQSKPTCTESDMAAARRRLQNGYEGGNGEGFFGNKNIFSELFGGLFGGN